MSNTTAAVLPLFVEGPADEPVEVLGLGAAETLAYVVERRRRQDEAAAEELRGVTQWADLHRVADGLVGAADPMVARPGRDELLGREGRLRLLGEGAFTVEEFAVCQLATALAMSETTARAYVGQALELRERLPKLWDQVMTGRLPAWKARQIATETIPLNAAAAAYVDAHLAPFATKMSLGRILRCVHAAAIRHDRALAAERAAKAAEGRGVWVDDDLDGTSRITAVTTTPDAAALEAAVHQVAGDLATLGSVAPEQVRRATALGVLADPQYALDLHATAEATVAQDTTDSETPGAGSGPAARPRRPRRTIQGPTLHIHLHTDAVTSHFTDDTSIGAGGEGGAATGHVARVNGRGPRSLATVKHWLTGLAPGTLIKVTPVVDLTEHISVDAYEHPAPLRDQVDERDHTCRFPWCGRAGRYDLDHIEPYVPLDDGGPPDQTSTHNTAKLCRFHHRVKTHGHWTYRRHGPTTLTWTSPLGRTYTVDEHGTLPRN